MTQFTKSYYKYGEADDDYTLPMQGAQLEFADKMMSEAQFQETPDEVYWLLVTKLSYVHCPKFYFAWDDAIYWCIVHPQIDEEGQWIESDSEIGMYLVEFTPGKIRCRFIDDTVLNKCFTGKTQEEIVEMADDFIYTPWYWFLEDQEAGRQLVMTEDQQKILDANLEWTDDYHHQLAEKFECSE